MSIPLNEGADFSKELNRRTDGLNNNVAYIPNLTPIGSTPPPMPDGMINFFSGLSTASTTNVNQTTSGNNSSGNNS